MQGFTVTYQSSEVTCRGERRGWVNARSKVTVRSKTNTVIKHTHTQTNT